ncbi:DHHC palmitoyltransferase-domain-containing protein [Halteromyces radiatus]|uniref:DHHC palmitoyltransferase-domain-containing protein n=1 Tax=Halteromyces radiatus TaxID=101107 RepID=UPI00221F6E21|nr:DHHC palmitoyltransferase-domain-containing protein [Halteromyces radiatus]KAI8085175.1 DHHC palmitoyltransferase-domain-containing protein [Halteromyces radiatus]
MAKPPSPLVRAITGFLLQVIVYGLLVYTWYIYVFRICVALLIWSEYRNVPLGVLIAFSSLFVLMAAISYTRIINADPGHPDQTPTLQSVESATTQSSQSHLPRYCYTPSLFDKTTMTSLPLQDTTILPALSIVSDPNGAPRFCDICKCFKPARTHHCSDCNVCVLKMDHHCPWINNCVGHHNYKFFFLFVSYTGLYGLWGLCSALPLVVIAMRDYDRSLDPQWIVFLIIAFVFGLTICGFALAHGQYILVNRTTIESLSTRPDHVRVDFDTSGQNYEVVATSLHDRLWNIGKMNNWRSVMGNHPIGWILPVYRGLGDGTIYPFNDASYHKILDQAKRQNDMI